jgi:hypothetical protein
MAYFYLMLGKTIFYSLLFLFVMKISSAQNPKQETPRSTLEEVFKAARTGDFTRLPSLCDPEGRNDGDTKQLCQITNATLAAKQDFRLQFRLAHSLEEKYIDEDSAAVTFKFGKKAELIEKMKLVKRNDKWYLISF